MTKQAFDEKRRDPAYRRAVAFIFTLRAEGVPLRVIVTNDWHSTTRPSVYVDVRGVKKTGFPLDYFKWQRGTRCGFSEKNVRRCVRLDRYGAELAAKWYKRKTIYV